MFWFTKNWPNVSLNQHKELGFKQANSIMDSGSIQLVIVILTQLFLFKVTPFKKAFCVCDCHVMTHTKARFVTNDQTVFVKQA